MKKLLAAMGAVSVLLGLTGVALAEEIGLAAPSSMIAIGALLVLMVVLIIFSAKTVTWDALMIAKAAVTITLAYMLGFITVFRMPMGGSVHLVAMLPLILFSVAFGPLEGLLVGGVYGLLELLIDPYVIHPLQLLVDYPMAYAAVALACAAKYIPVNARLKLPLAVLLGYFGRYIIAVLSGVVFFAEYAGDQGALAYSLIYNISYLGPEALACAIIALIPAVGRLPELIRDGFRKD